MSGYTPAMNKKPDKLRRSRWIRCRITPDQEGALLKNARKLHLTQAQYVRFMLFSGDGKALANGAR